MVKRFSPGKESLGSWGERSCWIFASSSSIEEESFEYDPEEDAE